eukprot:2796175-Rhodomonas_salina.1
MNVHERGGGQFADDRVTPAMPRKLNSSSRTHLPRPRNRNRGWDTMRSQQQTPVPQDQTAQGEGR